MTPICMYIEVHEDTASIVLVRSVRGSECARQGYNLRGRCTRVIFHTNKLAYDQVAKVGQTKRGEHKLTS